MAITFYAGSGSPYAWRVWLALEHKQLPYELKMLSFSNREHRAPEYLAINPRGKVPALVDGDLSLYESAAIVRYLEEAYPERTLFPGTPRERAKIHRLVAEADYLERAQHDIFGSVFFTPQDSWNLDLIETQRKALVAELGWLESALPESGDGFIAGPLSMADYAIYPVVAMSLRPERKKPDLAIAATLGPRTRAWKARIEALPHFDKTYPPHWRS